MLIRLKPFDDSTASGRANERYRRAALTAFASVVAKGIGLLTALVTVPLTVNYLGAERYGMWTTISSIATILAFADLGMANGLLNVVAEAYGRDDQQLARRYISSTFFILSGIAVVLALFLGAIYLWVPWKNVLNVFSPTVMAEIGSTVIIFMLCFLLNIPLGIVQQVRLAYQEGFANSLWHGIGSLLSVAGILLAIYTRADLPWLALALAGLPVASSLLNGMELFWRKRPWLRPRWKSVDLLAAQHVMKVSLLFFVLQIAIALGYQSDTLVIARFLGVDQVTQYAVPMKLFALTGLFLSFFLNPLWPAYREAITRRDMVWVRQTMKRSILLSLALTVPVASFLAVFGKQIIYLWVGPTVTPSSVLLLGLGLWVVFTGLSGSLAIFLNGANAVRFLVVCSLLMGISNLMISILLVQYIGVSGVIYGSLIAQLLFIFLPSLIYVPRLLASFSVSMDSSSLSQA